MRPSVLNPLFADVTTISGIGGRLREGLARAAGDKIKDILFHIPHGYLDRRYMPELMTAPDGAVITSIIVAEEYQAPPPRTKQPFKIICKNDTGYLTLVFFNHNDNYIIRQLPIGQKRVVSGKVERFDGMLQMVHPDSIGKLSELENIQRIEPVYSLTYALTKGIMLKAVRGSLAVMPDLGEWIEPELLEKKGWDSWKKSILRTHNPKGEGDMGLTSSAISRLAYDELFANQMALALSRGLMKKKVGQKTDGNGRLCNALISSLPFKLTNGQSVVLKDIFSDMNSDYRMLRLLQGDVGSGKTVVALISMLNAVECGRQAVLMAPTEILARQHMAWISSAIENANLVDEVRVELLTGRDKGKKYNEKIEQIKSGLVNIIIGTHSLFQEKVEFNDLAFAVIDEQHRFGVEQRLSLAKKGKNTDILLMTATPIPRTLTLTLYGDMEVSNLREKPAGRKPIDTRTIPISKVANVVEGVKRAVGEGRRVYWVCPLIEESEDGSDLAAAEDRYHKLKKIFADRVGLVHGKMKADERDRVMMAFKAGDIDILVATTVIEVGVDVPEASVMVIEQAERFGLSQLHQLRGRVGRGFDESSCMLVFGYQIGEIGKKRLKIMRETEDGFRIAEEDLILRGSGDVLGTKQSGMQDFKIAIFPEHTELLFMARDSVKEVLENDIELKTERGQNIRNLLYLFEYDHQIKYLMSG